jgi:hypothetical protein
MDPFTILAIAKGSYEAIKSGIKVGKEVHGMFSDVSKLWGSCAQLARMAAEPPKSKLFSKQTAEQIAIDAFTAKMEAEKYSEEIKNLFLAEYGLTAWNEIQKEIIRIKKEQKAAAIIAKQEAEQFIDDIILVGIVVIAATVIVGTLAALMLSIK